MYVYIDKMYIYKQIICICKLNSMYIYIIYLYKIAGGFWGFLHHQHFFPRVVSVDSFRIYDHLR